MWKKNVSLCPMIELLSQRVVQQKTRQNRRKYVASWKQEKKRSVHETTGQKRMADDRWQWMTHTGHKTHKWTLQLWKCDSNVVNIVRTNLLWAKSNANYDPIRWNEWNEWNGKMECGVISKFLFRSQFTKFRAFTRAFGSTTLIDAAFD